MHLDTITYRIMSDANIRAANLRSGDIQVADTISTQDVDALVEERGVGLLQTSSLGYQAMTINIGNTDGAGEPPKQIDTPLASDPRVRLALAYAVDRDALVNSVFNNWYEPACSPIPPTSPYASPGGEACVPHDPAKARELLAAGRGAGPVPDHGQDLEHRRVAALRAGAAGSGRTGRLRAARSSRSSTRRCSTSRPRATSTRSCSAGPAGSTRTAT